MRKTLTTLALTVVVLLGLGIVVLASASAVRAQGLYADPHYYVNRQLIWLGLSVLVVYAASRFDYHWWKETPLFTIGFYVLVVIALVLVFCPGIGSKVKGSHRWLTLGPLRVQPSEFAKILTVIAMGVWMDRIGWRVRKFVKGALLPAAGLGLIAALLVLEPDFGSTMVVCVVGGAMMFVVGTRIPHLMLLGAGGCAMIAPVILKNANRMNRILAWQQGEESESAAAYQLQRRSSPSRMAGRGVWALTRASRSTTTCRRLIRISSLPSGERSWGFAFPSRLCWRTSSFSFAAC